MTKVIEADQRIFIVGMMGVGKTTIGKQLAQKLNKTFVDLDEEITKRTKLSVSQLFEKHGEFNFRACEAQVLRELIHRHESAVVATGGGTPLHFNNMDFMNANGLTIWLEVASGVLIGRLENQRNARPLLIREDWKSFLAELVYERKSAYAHAEVSIDVSNHSPESATNAIAAALPEVVGH